MFDLSTTSLNSQHSRYGPSDSDGSSINIGDNSSPIDIEGHNGSGPKKRNKTKLQEKNK